MPVHDLRWTVTPILAFFVREVALHEEELSHLLHANVLFRQNCNGLLDVAGERMLRRMNFDLHVHFLLFILLC